MIIAEWKPIDEIKAMLSSHKNILIAGCGTCVAECAAGGEKEVETLGSTDLGLTRKEVGEEGSWLKVEKMYALPAEKEAVIISGSPEDMAAKIIEVLKTQWVI